MSRVEIITTGIDEALASIGGDPQGRNGSMGLRIPSLALQTQASKPVGAFARYLFMLCSFSMPDHGRAKIRGMRKYLSLGENRGSEGVWRPVEQQIKNPQWHPPGGNVSWHVMDLGPPNGTTFMPATRGPVLADNFAYQNSLSPALLYQSATLLNPYYVSLTAYTPPNGGQPYGTPLLEGGFATRYDLEEQWRSSHAWDSFDKEVCGPRTIAVYASVRQADTTITNYALPELGSDPGASGYGNGLSDEEAFLVNFTGASYWRIAASLIVET